MSFGAAFGTSTQCRSNTTHEMCYIYKVRICSYLLSEIEENALIGHGKSNILGEGEGEGVMPPHLPTLVIGLG